MFLHYIVENSWTVDSDVARPRHIHAYQSVMWKKRRQFNKNHFNQSNAKTINANAETLNQSNMWTEKYAINVQ